MSEISIAICSGRQRITIDRNFTNQNRGALKIPCDVARLSEFFLSSDIFCLMSRTQESEQQKRNGAGKNDSAAQAKELWSWNVSNSIFGKRGTSLKKCHCQRLPARREERKHSVDCNESDVEERQNRATSSLNFVEVLSPSSLRGWGVEIRLRKEKSVAQCCILAIFQFQQKEAVEGTQTMLFEWN
jgi:hypothetical protein